MMEFEVANLSKTCISFLGKRLDVIVESHAETIGGNTVRSYTAYVGKKVPTESYAPKGFGNTRRDAVRSLVFELVTKPQYAAEREMAQGDYSEKF